ncbi:MAG: hypothetical protein H6819_12045 [Phycisphaerales bacterium]|nr:hypothetical protein [Phycisphaerales bacterium]MCB9858040.1 hypothetical protein [Phycisphaerales bacterium]MCB9864137.1 hypothetical protein [Phycisphaerales bacterium]
MSIMPGSVDVMPSGSTESMAISNPPTVKARPFFAAGATAFVVSLVISNNWFFACVYAGLCAGVAAVVIVWLLESMAGRYLRSRAIQVWLPVGIGMACSFLSFLTVDQAFERIFEMTTPLGVSDAHVRRAYCGGGGDEDTILWFHATPAAVEKLIEARAFQRVPEESLVEQRDRAVMVGAFATWSRTFAGRLQRIWLDEGGREMPEVYAFRPEYQAEETWLVYDREKGFVIVIYKLT